MAVGNPVPQVPSFIDFVLLLMSVVNDQDIATQI